MTNKVLMSLAVAALMVSPFAAQAQDGPPPEGGPPGVSKEKLAEMKARGEARFKAVDTNGDTKIQKDEFIADAEKRFEEMDADNDGSVTREERKAAHEKMRKEFGGRGGPGDKPPAE